MVVVLKVQEVGVACEESSRRRKTKQAAAAREWTHILQATVCLCGSSANVHPDL